MPHTRLDEMDEKQLIASCLKGEQTAWKALYDAYSGRMLGLCLRYVADREVARDVLQDGFVKVFASLSKFRGEGPLGAWIRKIFVNESLEYLRRTQTLRRETISLDVTAFSPAVEATALARLSADDLMAMVQELPPSLRTVFNLLAIEGYSHKEIAAKLQIEESTSRAHYMRARRWLQQKINGEK